MDVWKLIDSVVTRKQLPYVRLITIYLHNAVVTGICIARYTDKNIIKKAKKVGLNEDRMMTILGKGLIIKNFNAYDLQKGDYYLNYDTASKEITIYKF